MARSGAGQFHFTVTELFVLAISFFVTSCLVFLLGFYVGRETGRPHLPAASRVARISVGAVPQPDADVAEVPVASSVAAVSPPAEREFGDEVKAAPEAKVPPVAEQLLPESQTPREPPVAVPYTVQVLATRNLGEAESLVASLKRRGMGAFVATVDGSAGKWYRVRIGRFDDVRSAQRMADRCRRDFGLSQAYVSAVRNEQ